MKRYITINGVEFEKVKEIPCRTDFTGRRLEDVYTYFSRGKADAFNAWEKWATCVKSWINDSRLVIDDMWIASHTVQFFTIVFKGSYQPENERTRVDFIACATGRHNYIKLIYERMV